jgi:tetratricopeptide (TPR) repeat protein
MIAVAILAPLLAVGIEVVLHNPLDEMYGSHGLIESRRQFYAEVSDGDSALQDGLYAKAEQHFRAALKLFHSPSERRYMKDPVGDEVTPSLGLADALAGQGRFREAEAFYKRSLAVHRDSCGSDRRGCPEEDRILDHYAATLRRIGRMTEANELAARPGEIHKRSSQEPEK